LAALTRSPFGGQADALGPPSSVRLWHKGDMRDQPLMGAISVRQVCLWVWDHRNTDVERHRRGREHGHRTPGPGQASFMAGFRQGLRRVCAW
jgi:hypothetical protein